MTYAAAARLRREADDDAHARGVSGHRCVWGAREARAGPYSARTCTFEQVPERRKPRGTAEPGHTDTPSRISTARDRARPVSPTVSARMIASSFAPALPARSSAAQRRSGCRQRVVRVAAQESMSESYARIREQRKRAAAKFKKCALADVAPMWHLPPHTHTGQLHQRRALQSAGRAAYARPDMIALNSAPIAQPQAAGARGEEGPRQALRRRRLGKPPHQRASRPAPGPPSPVLNASFPLPCPPGPGLPGGHRGGPRAPRQGEAPRQGGEHGPGQLRRAEAEGRGDQERLLRRAEGRRRASPASRSPPTWPLSCLPPRDSWRRRLPLTQAPRCPAQASRSR